MKNILSILFLFCFVYNAYSQSDFSQSPNVLSQENIIEYTNLEGKVFYIFNGSMQLIPADKLSTLSVTEYTDLQGNTYRSYDNIHWAIIGKVTQEQSATAVKTIPVSNLYMEKGDIIPNPASRSAQFRVLVKKSGTLTISLQSSTGSFNQSLFSGTVTQGQFDKTLDISKLSSGNYTCIFEMNRHTISSSLLIVP